MLLQSHTGTIVVFPAVPESWRDVAFTTLRAGGAFRVSAERQAGKTVEVEIASENGGACRLESPFTGAVVNLSFVAGETRVFREDP